MLIEIKLNKYNYINEYAIIGSITDGIKVEFPDDNINNILNYQYINNELILNPIPEIPVDMIKPEYNGKSWIETATELEVAELQYTEYDALDKPSVIDEMNLIDPTLGQELKNMLIELRGIISTLKEQQSRVRVGYSSIHIPEPSKKLEDFKNKFNKFKK